MRRQSATSRAQDYQPVVLGVTQYPIYGEVGISHDRTGSAFMRWNYLHIHNDVIPALEQKGVTREQLDKMLVDNPRRIFERQGGY